MENVLVVLIFVASIIYKIYTNFKKEMEKSAQRNPKRPSAPNYTDNIPKEVSQTPPPLPATKAEVAAQKTNRDFVTKNKGIQEIPEEVQRVKQRRKSNHPAPHDVSNSKEEEAKEYSFDLREAVIQAAILERPYK